ncbi:MAG: hypothetical protein AAGM22_07905 [Acidobacteriota bacterium]
MHLSSEPIPRPYALAALAAVGVGLVFLHVNAYVEILIDDAFIFLQFAETLLADGTWGFYPGMEANTVTSPLTVLVLAVLTLIVPGAAAAVAFDTLAWSAMLGLLLLMSRRFTGLLLPGVIAGAALLFNPLMVSSLGMEASLFGALFFGALYAAAAERFRTSAALAALLTLARPDGALLFVLLWPQIPGWRERLRSILAFGLTAAPWYLYSWVYLGSLLPESFFIKTSTLAAWGPWTFSNGFALYFGRMQLEILLTVFFALFLVLLPRFKGSAAARTAATAGAFALGHGVVYSAMEVPPYHWYYVPQILALVFLGAFALGLSRPSDDASPARRTAWRLAIAAALLVPALGLLELHRRAGFDLQEMPLHSNWASAREYREIAEWLGAEAPRHAFGLVGGEIGALSYYCDCYFLDHFTDRRVTAVTIKQSLEKRSWMQPLMLLNFFFYEDANTYPPVYFFLKGDLDSPSEGLGPLVKRWQFGNRWEQETWLSLFAIASKMPNHPGFTPPGAEPDDAEGGRAEPTDLKPTDDTEPPAAETEPPKSTAGP